MSTIDEKLNEVLNIAGEVLPEPTQPDNVIFAGKDFLFFQSYMPPLSMNLSKSPPNPGPTSD